MEKGIGNGTTDAFMKEKKQEGYLNPFLGKAKAIVLRVSLN